MKSPVLFVVFNRPDTTGKVFEAIRKARPPRLYIAADGPRKHVENESALCREVRRIVSDVTWPCEVKTLFRDENIGCKLGVSGGIDWFFQHEEEGIILEDDVLPHPAFFTFCDRMLDLYRNDSRIMMVCGFNPFGADVVSDGYFFSENPSVWGWATWRSRWELYDREMNNWPSETFTEYLRRKFPFHVYHYYKKAFDRTKNGKIKSWDYQWTYCILSNYALVAKPFANLVMNIGTEGTHARKKDHNHFVPYGKFDMKFLSTSPEFTPDLEQDHHFYATRIKNGPTLYLKVFLRHILPSANI